MPTPQDRINPGINLAIPTDPLALGSASAYGQSFQQALALPGFNLLDSPQFAEIRKLFAPTDSGLSPALQTQYQFGANEIARTTDKNRALALTSAEDRGIAGSTPAMAGVGAAEFAGQNALASFLAQIMGQQQGQNSQLAQLLFGGLQAGQGDFNARLQALLQYLQGGQSDAANATLFNNAQNSAMDLARENNKSQIISSLIGAGGGMAKAAIPLIF